MGFSRRRLCAALAASAALLACSTNPVTGRPEFVLMSSQREKEVGREAAAQVAQQMGLIEDAALVGYVSELGQRVARHSPRQDVAYSFHVVDMEEPNAFALPGGYIYVSRGLLALSNDESELANVLAHEIAHVAARHSAQRQTRAVGVGLVLLPAAVGGALLGSVLGMPGDLVGATVNAPLQMLGVGFISAYGRDQEREADRVGQKMAAEAGIDPGGLSDFLDTLEAYERLKTGKTRRPSFFDSHPTTPERVATTAKRAGGLEWAPQPGAGDRAAFLARIEGLLVGRNPAEGVFDGQRFLHPDLDFTVRFPDEWNTVNARAGVGGFAPARDGQILLELQGPGDDPRRAASQALESLPAPAGIQVIDSTELRVGPYPAFRAHLLAARGRDSLPLDITWIAKDGLVYRFTAMAGRERFAAYRAAMRAVPDGFRALSPAERESVRENRLRLVSARAGESLESLGARTGNAWSAAETAVANALPEGILESGRVLKIAVPQRYQPDASALQAVE